MKIQFFFKFFLKKSPNNFELRSELTYFFMGEGGLIRSKNSAQIGSSTRTNRSHSAHKAERETQPQIELSSKTVKMLAGSHPSSTESSQKSFGRR